MGMTCSLNGGKNNSHKILVVKLEGNVALGRHRRRWGIILKWILEIGWSGMYSFDLAQDRNQSKTLVNMVKNLWVPQNV
jgi:hypothetical protein